MYRSMFSPEGRLGLRQGCGRLPRRRSGKTLRGGHNTARFKGGLKNISAPSSLIIFHSCNDDRRLCEGRKNR